MYMIKIYTDFEKFKNIDGILSPDSYFNITVTTDMLSEECKNILMKYEKAKVISFNLLDGRFGPFPLNSISSGVKTIILLQLMKEKVIAKPAYINLSECGENILYLAFKYVEYMKIPVFLRNSVLYNVDDYEFLVNSKYKVYSADELMDTLVNIYSREVM